MKRGSVDRTDQLPDVGNSYLAITSGLPVSIQKHPARDRPTLHLWDESVSKIVPGMPPVPKTRRINHFYFVQPRGCIWRIHCRCHSQGPRHRSFNFGLDRAQQRVGTSWSIRPVSAWGAVTDPSDNLVRIRALRTARMRASRGWAQKGQFPGFGRSVRSGFAPTGTIYVTTASATLPVSFLTM